MKTIVITGTKGKTSVALFLNRALTLLKNKTYCISSDGVFRNSRKIKSNEYFLEKYKTSANAVALKEVVKKEIKKVDFLIVESSYANLGQIENSFLKNNVDFSILTNVYWDHVDGEKIKNRKALFEKKYKIINNTKQGGVVFIFAGDKKSSLSYRAIDMLRKTRKDLTVVAYGKNFIKEQGVHKDGIFLKNKKIYLGKKEALDLNKLKHVFKDELFVTNLMVFVALLTKLKMKREKLYALKKDDLIISGRFNVFIKDDKKVILDLAHEVKSITASAKKLRGMFKKNKIKAIIRFSYYRNDAYITVLVNKIVKLFDSYIVYDKAISRPLFAETFIRKYNREKGSLGKLVYALLRKQKKKAIRIDDEMKAIKHGIRTMKNNEILYIIGDQIDKDVALIKKELKIT